MVWALAAVICSAIVLPHALRLEHSSPPAAATVWLSALLLRALTAVFAAIYVVVAVPATRVFGAVTHWCWHAVVPGMATHLGLDGHAFGDAALVLPAVLLSASVLSVAFGIWKAARAVGGLIQRSQVGEGPRNSVILGDGDVLVAAAGLRRPRVLVSAGALTSFDDDELDASLAHEQGHIARRHRYVLVVGELCRALGRCLPGTRAAARELAFHLERDADHFALRRDHAPAALASAICKAAQPPTAAALSALSGGGVTRRIRELLDVDRQPITPSRVPVRALAAAMVTLVVALGAALPPATVAAVGEAHAADVRHCVE